MTSLRQLREEAAGCRACPLWRTATQTVFGEGAARAQVLFVGEQPGDQEDKEGRPFAACHPWLESELAVVKPKVLVCLGATAAQALLGKQFRVTKRRGTWVESEWAPHVTATIHPSAVLRQRTDEDRHREMGGLVADLKLVAAVLK